MPRALRIVRGLGFELSASGLSRLALRWLGCLRRAVLLSYMRVQKIADPQRTLKGPCEQADGSIGGETLHLGSRVQDKAHGFASRALASDLKAIRMRRRLDSLSRGLYSL